MDPYSRKILGYSCSHTLLTEYTTLPALNMALNNRGIQKATNTVFHSDGGGQYYSKAFLSLTSQACLQNSMAKQAYDNPHAERVNGTIKNDYLKHYNPKTADQLATMLKRAVDNYNIHKPHS